MALMGWLPMIERWFIFEPHVLTDYTTIFGNMTRIQRAHQRIRRNSDV